MSNIIVYAHVYFCTQCDRLLMEIDTTRITRSKATMEQKYAGYVDNEITVDLDDQEIYYCPECDKATNNYLAIPQAYIEKLVNLWEILKEEECNDLLHGIPMKEPRLTEIIAEAFL